MSDTQEKFGIQIFDESGELLLEVGSHIIQNTPIFAEKIGAIAASWAQIEVSLNCFFASLPDITPNKTANQIKNFRSAAKVTNAARKLATELLTGQELQSITNDLKRLDLLREQRNRIQHDIWAKKGNKEEKLFTIHADQYLKFATELVALAESSLSNSEKIQSIIKLANDFTGEIEKGFTINDLQKIETEINGLNQSLTKAMFFRISQRSLEKIKYEDHEI